MVHVVLQVGLAMSALLIILKTSNYKNVLLKFQPLHSCTLQCSSEDIKSLSEAKSNLNFEEITKLHMKRRNHMNQRMVGQGSLDMSVLYNFIWLVLNKESANISCILFPSSFHP